MIRLLMTFLALPALASADSARLQSIVSEHILPGFEKNMAEAEGLRIKSEKGCPEDPSVLREGFHSSFDAWIAVSHLRFGPTETDNRAFALAFWPDPRNAAGKTVAKLLAASDPVVSSPEAFREISVAGQGFFAMERLLFGEIPIAENEYACELLKAIAGRIAEVSAEIYAEWENEYSALYLRA